MFRYLEKKFNARIIDLLIAGTSIDTDKMSPEGKSFYGRLKRFFERGLEQMQHDLWWKPKSKGIRKSSQQDMKH